MGRFKEKVFLKAKEFFRENVFIAALSCVAIGTWLLLALGCPDYLRRVEALSLFLPTKMFWVETVQTPAGVLEWCGRLLTQTFHLPWLGGAVYGALLALAAWLTAKAVGLQGRWRCLSLLVPACILWAFLSMGYLIFSSKTPAYAMQTPLGVCFAMSAAWLMRETRPWWLQLVVVVSLVALGYYVVGFYALLGATVFVATVLVRQAIGRRRGVNAKALISAFVAVWAIAFTPIEWASIAPGNLMEENKYTAGLLRVQTDDDQYWWGRGPVALTDSNFRLTLKLTRAIEEGRSYDGVTMAFDHKVEPTRLNVVLTDIALMQLGAAGDWMFRLPIGAAEYNSSRASSALHDAGALVISYYLGRTNLAYRWAMEYAVERGYSVEYLKYMTKCALLNGEMKLAEKYIDILSLTAFHKDWAKKYSSYLTNPTKLAEDPELSWIRPIKINENYLYSDGGKLERHIWPQLSESRLHTPQMLQLSMYADLIFKQLDSFMAKVPTYMEQYKALPLHFQEAVLLWSGLHNNKEYEKYNIDKNLQARFARYVQKYEQLKGLDSAVKRDVLGDEYADTFWYYMMLVNDIKLL